MRDRLVERNPERDGGIHVREVLREKRLEQRGLRRPPPRLVLQEHREIADIRGRVAAPDGVEIDEPRPIAPDVDLPQVEVPVERRGLDGAEARLDRQRAIGDPIHLAGQLGTGERQERIPRMAAPEVIGHAARRPGRQARAVELDQRSGSRAAGPQVGGLPDQAAHRGPPHILLHQHGE